MSKRAPGRVGRRISHARIAALCALMSAAAAWSATDTARDTIVLWTGDDQWVRIERQDDSAAAPNDHPAQLGTDEVSRALGALRVRVPDSESGTESQRGVFARDELAQLAPQVAAGLAKAGPKQDVTFSTIGAQAVSSGGLVKDPGVNAGRVFYRDGKLNVIFGELQSNYRKKNVYGQRTEDFTPRRQGSRDKASKQKLTFAVTSGVELHAASGGSVRNDWVVIDPAVAGAQTVATSEPAAAAPREAAAPASAQPASPPPPASTAAGAGAATAAGSAAGATSVDLEKRLQTLKDLRDKGLISEEAYNSKVKELLSEL